MVLPREALAKYCMRAGAESKTMQVQFTSGKVAEVSLTAVNILRALFPGQKLFQLDKLKGKKKGRQHDKQREKRKL